MRISKICSCGYKGELYLPYVETKPKNTIITCPSCRKKEDMAYFYGIKAKSLEELEKEEYERLKRKFWKG